MVHSRDGLLMRIRPFAQLLLSLMLIGYELFFFLTLKVLTVLELLVIRIMCFPEANLVLLYI